MWKSDGCFRRSGREKFLSDNDSGDALGGVVVNRHTLLLAASLT
jgi:hypothetical protein